ncbi:hypothetical protein MMC25_000531 [Agyrium rufum]|nr:hypothetical protein [Agyrium rufum]
MFRSQLHRIEPNTYRHELPIGTASVMFHMPIKVWKNAQGFYLCPICHSDAIFLNPVRCQDCKSVFPDTIIWLGDPGVDYLSEGGDEGSEANANTNGDHRGDHQSSPAPSAIMPNGHVSVPSVSDAGPTPDPEERPQRMDLLPSTRSEPDINRGRRMDRPTSDRRPLPRTRGGARARFTESGDTTILKDEFRFIFEKGNFEQRKQEAAELVSALDSTANDQPNDSKQSHVQDDLARSATSKKSIPDEGLQRRRLPGAYFPNGCIVSSALNGVSCKSASSESIKVPMYSSELTQSPERLLTEQES